jgi:hypothetical protein
MWKRGQRANGATVTSPGATTSIDGSPWKRGVRDEETARWEREGDGGGREERESGAHFNLWGGEIGVLRRERGERKMRSCYGESVTALSKDFGSD